MVIVRKKICSVKGAGRTHLGPRGLKPELIFSMRDDVHCVGLLPWGILYSVVDSEFQFCPCPLALDLEYTTNAFKPQCPHL